MTKDEFYEEQVLIAFDMLLRAIQEVEKVWGGNLKIRNNYVTDIMTNTYPEQLPDFIEIDSCLRDWAYKVIREVSK